MNLYQDVFFRALDGMRGRRTVERLRFLRASQRWDGQRLRAWQLKRLNALLRQARDASPFHRERLADVRLPLTSLADLETLPILTKAQIQTNLETIKTDNLDADRYVLNRTGGSTGEPTFYYWDKAGQDWNRGSVYRSAEWAGTALGERALQMSASHFDYSQSRRLAHRFTYWLQRYRDCPVAAVTDEMFERYYQQLMRFRPASVWGYASALDAFARFVETNHPEREYPFLRALITSSETLQHEQRARIERAFGADKVYDHYGSREVYLAAECAVHHGYHIHAEVLVVEVVDDLGRAQAPGTPGRVLVTDLSNHAFPFVRYEIGDRATMADDTPCPCGVTLPRLERVEGRLADVIVLRDRILTPPNFSVLFTDKPGIRAYQIRQDSLDEVRVLMEPGEGFSDATREYIADSMRTMVGGQARVSVVTDEPIVVPESGKRRFVVSSVEREVR